MKADFSYFVHDDRIAIAEAEFALPGRRTYKWVNPDRPAVRTMLLDYDMVDIDFTLPGKIYRQIVRHSDDSSAADTDSAVFSGVHRKNGDMYAIVIANGTYSTGMTVPYARNDGEVFRRFCVDRLRMPEDNICYVDEADAEDMRNVLSWLDRVSRMFNADTRLVVYFSGQCLLDKGVGETYLLPVDYASAGVQSGLRLSSLFNRISGSGIDDAIFIVDASYGKISRNGMMYGVFDDGGVDGSWMRPDDRMVVFYAAGEDEGAYPYPEKKHGLFTYFLLKALQDNPDGISYGDLFDYISANVESVSAELYGRRQKPEVYSSEWDGEAWREFSL